MSQRPAILVAWEQADREDGETFYDAWKGREVPAAVSEANGMKIQRAFAAMYEQLSPQQRSAEAARLNEAIGDPPEYMAARAAADYWDSAVSLWGSHVGRVRSQVELQATTLAEAALAHCTYLGGFVEYPRRVETNFCVCNIGTGGNIHWEDRNGSPLCGAAWDQIVELRVGPTDRSPERFTASRIAVLGPFALAAKKQRREAMLGVKTLSGEGVLIVHGHTPLDLEAQIAPLAACVGVPSSDAYTFIASGVRAHR
jgi:hypothetical protein